MNTQAEITLAAHPDDPDVKAPPPFAISVWDSAEEPGEVDLIVHYTNTPSPTKTASTALMVGLGILIAEQQGEIDNIISRTFPDGPPSEAEAVAYAELLITGNANDLPA